MDGTDNTLARVEFDATLEEVVDEQIRFAGSTKTFARQRLIQVVSTGMGATVGLLAMWYWRRDSLPADLLLGAIALGVALGTLVGYLAGVNFDWRVKRYVRRTINEHYSAAGKLHHEIEIRPDGLRCLSRGIELTLPWDQFSRRTDAAGAIDLWFSSPALVRIPGRAFPRHEDRLRFLQLAITTAAARNDSRKSGGSAHGLDD